MLVRVEELERWKRKLIIGLPEADVLAKAKELLGEVAKSASVPGFRKGKVPAGMIEKSHGAATLDEALRIMAGGAYADAVREADLHPISDPVVELGEDVEDGQYTLTATVEVKPDVELKDYENLEFTERVPVVGSEDVDKYVEGLREERAELLQVTRPAIEGDILVLDYVPLGDDGAPMAESKAEDYICELGKGQVPSEIEKALVGVGPGEDKTVAVSYPDDFQVESLAGREVSFAISVKDVRQKRLPVVDDDFAKACGPFETMLDLRVRVRNALEARAKSWARNRLEEDIVRELIERNPFTLPEGLMSDRLKRTYWRTTQQQDGSGEPGDAADGPPADLEVPEEFAKVYSPVVEHQLKAGLILGKIAEKHGTSVTKEDIEAKVSQIAEAQGREPDEL
ncbi:MAG: trigger factor, partial [Candidatus Eisenbacteria bacterium]|nr:trigger factor [Candidatus Eisenbacteria bacterium]